MGWGLGACDRPEAQALWALGGGGSGYRRGCELQSQHKWSWAGQACPGQSGWASGLRTSPVLQRWSVSTEADSQMPGVGGWPQGVP